MVPASVPVLLPAGRCRAGRVAEGARRTRGGDQYRGGNMEQGSRRRAFGSSICPNRVQDAPARLAKKAVRPGGAGTARTNTSSPNLREPPSRTRRSGAPPAPALALTTIDWQDVAACAPILPTTPAGPVTLQQSPYFQDGPEFDCQEFRDAVDDFINDASTSMPPPLDCTDFDFSLGEEVDFGSCTLPLETSELAQVPSQYLPSPEPCWRDLADQHQKALGNALEANSQLQETLMQRQEELVTLQQSNMELKELASQARQLATVLDTLMLPQCADGATLPPPPPPLHPPSPTPSVPPSESWGGRGRPERREEVAGVDAMLQAVSDKCRAALRSLRGSPGGSSGGSPTAKRLRPAPRLHGAFRGLRTGRSAPRPGDEGLEGDRSLRAALGEEGGIRTMAFPQGSAFTLRTAAGGYRFRWVPR
ncbi:multicilin [Heliangelus exortis]|uniref:multicilin n=1 Tax=Heliangelus exortis TaxID=472823 RepID=UPI003A9060A0